MPAIASATRLIAEAMEERILHSADLGPLALADMAPQAWVQQPVALATDTTAGAGTEIAFVDAGVPDAATLVADLQAQRDAGRPIEIVLIGVDQDGVALISDTLAGRSDLSAVHVLAHGSDGALQLGNTTLDASTLLQRAGDVAAWGAALSADADLLLYGCNLAQTPVGRQFVQDLTALTGADVAASVDITGATAQGGNWTLEFGTGRIEAAGAIAAAGHEAWSGTLAVSFTSESSGGTKLATTSYNFAHNVNSGSDRLLLVELVIANGVDATAVTFNGTALTFLARQDSPTGHVGVEVWYLVAPPVTSGTVDVTLASASTLVAGATSYSGVNQTVPFDTPVKAASSNWIPWTAMTADPGDLVVDIVGARQVAWNAIGLNQTQNFEQNQGTGVNDLFGVSSREDGAALVVLSHGFSGVDGNWASIGVEINQAGAAPAVASTGSPSSYVENQAATAIDPGLTVSDADSTNLTGATVSISVNYANGQDVLGFTDQFGITGSWSAGGGVLTLSGAASVADYQTALRSVSYSNSSENPSTLVRTVSFVVSDGAANSTPATRNISVAAVNDAPDITSNAGGGIAAVSVSENANAVTTVVATDPDATTPTYRIAGGTDAGHFAIDPTTGVLTFASAPDFEAPTDSNGNNIYQVQVEAWDGTNATGQVINVTVTDSAITSVSASGGASVTAGAAYTLNLSANEDATSWTINWGDGSIQTVSGDPATVTHTYTRAGFTFNILASATDASGTVHNSQLLVPTYGSGDSVMRFAPMTGAHLQTFADHGSTTNSIQAVVGPDGQLYVTQEGQNTVRRYDTATGALIGTFVAIGSGGLSTTGGLAFGPDGHLYVASYGSNQVLRYDGTTGAFMDAFIPSVSRPYGLTFGADGRLYVGLYTSHAVARYDATSGALVDTFVSAGSGGLNSPEQLTFGPDGHLYVASHGSHAVLRYDGSTGSFMGAFVAAGAGGLNKPSGVSFGPDGALYVASLGTDSILRYSGSTGAYLGAYVAAGTGGLVSPAIMTFVPQQQVQVLANEAPTGAPVMTGTPTEDETLGIDTSSINDADGLGVFSHQWLRDGVDVAGATGATYTLGDADVGAAISVRVSYIDGRGTLETLTSDPTAAVANVNDNPAGLPVLTGTPTESQTLGVDTSGITDADGLGSFSYQWLRDGVDVAVASGATYTLGDADVGAAIGVRVSYTDGQGTLETLTSDPTAAVANVNDAPIGLPTVSGTPAEYATLSAVTSGINDADGLGSFSHQWQRDGVDVGGATGATYTLSAADIGSAIRVRVAYTDGQGTLETLTSEPTAAVANVNDAPVNMVPGAQATPFNTPLLFSGASVISVADVDAGANPLQVTLAATQGTLTLGSTAGLSFSSGTGAGDVTMTFQGTTNNINAALAGATFTPAAVFSGAATVQITTDDLAGRAAGNTAVFGSSTTSSAFDKKSIGTQVNVGADGMLTSITAYLINDKVNTVRYGLYTDVAGEPGTLLAEASATLAQDLVGRWTTLQLPNTALSAGDYWIALDIGKDGRYFYSATGGNTRFSNFDPNAGFASPAWSGTYRSNSQALSAYLSYTASSETGLSDTDTVNITVGNNAAPVLTGANDLAAIDEDPVANPGTLVSALISGKASDVDTGALAGIAVTAVDNSQGAWEYSTDSGSTWAAFGTPDAIDARLLAADAGSYLRFVPNPDWHGTAGSGITFHAWDRTSGTVGATANVSANGGTTAFSIQSASASVTVNAVNDAPQATNLSTAQTYTEDTPLALTPIVIGDVDSASVTATLTMSLPAAGSLNTATSGGVTSSYDAVSGVWSASGAITDVNALLAGLIFTPAADDNGNFTIATRVSDGVAAPVTGSKTITGGPVNDAPTGLPTITGTPTEDQTLSADTSAIADADALGAFSYLWTRNGATIAGASGSTYMLSDVDVGAQIRVVVSYADGGGTAEILTSAAVGPVANVNDAPSGAPVITGTPTEDQTLSAVTSAINDADGLGSISFQWQRDGVDVGGATGAAYTLSAADIGAAISVRVAYTDGQGTLESLTSDPTAAVGHVNDAPQATNLSTAQTYTEDMPLALAPIVIGDVDSANVTATLTLSRPVAGRLNTATSGGVTSSYDAVSGVWSASGAITDVNALLAGLTFTPTADHNDNFTIATRVSDGIAPALTGNKAMTGMPVNDGPWLATTADPLVYTENQEPLAIDPGLAITFDGTENLLGATVTIAAGRAPGQDMLGFVDQFGIRGHWDAGTGVLTLTGTASATSYLSALRTVTYANASENPDTTNRRIDFVLDDGLTPGTVASKSVIVQAVNDPPATLAVVLGAVAEDSGLRLITQEELLADATDMDGPALTASALAIASGSGRLVDHGDGTWSYTPAADDDSEVRLSYLVTDGAMAVPGGVTMDITPVNDMPQLTQALADQSIDAGASMRFQLPPATFFDADANGSLHYSATLADGTPLPAWLHFDALTLTFTGTPAASDAVSSVVRVTVTDASGAAAETTFVIAVLAIQTPAAAPAAAPSPAPDWTSGVTVETGSAATLPPQEAPPPRAVDATPADASAEGTPAAAAPGRTTLDDPGPAWLAPPTTPQGSDLPARSALPAAWAAGVEPGRAANASRVVDIPIVEAPALADPAMAAAALAGLLESGELQYKLDELLNRARSPGEAQRAMVEAALTAASGLSVGYVIWLVRGGVLVGSMLSALPAWQMIDPVPMLAAAGAARRRRTHAEIDADAKAERLFDRHAAPPPPAADPDTTSPDPRRVALGEAR